MAHWVAQLVTRHFKRCHLTVQRGLFYANPLSVGHCGRQVSCSNVRRCLSYMNASCMQALNGSRRQRNTWISNHHNKQLNCSVPAALCVGNITSSSSMETVTKSKVRGIQKDVSPLTTKRIVRRKKTKDSMPRDQEVFDVVAYATAEEYCLETLQDELTHQGLYGVLKLPEDAPDALHVEALYRVGDDPREIFLFREGSVVFWNMPEVEREAVLKFLRRHQEGSYDQMLFKEEYEHVEFTYTEQATQLQGDEIQLQRLPVGEQQMNLQLEKYAFSNAIALSVKLSIWEASLDKYVDSIEFVLQDLKLGRKLKISREEVLRKTGELLTLRHLINLSTDLLDTPDFYWDREKPEELYSRTTAHLHISRRTKVMNEKLTHCYELAELLREQLQDSHHIRLEWMIIILIMIEVFFEIQHMFERWSEKKEEERQRAVDQ